MKRGAVSASSCLNADLAFEVQGSGPLVALVHGSAPAACWGAFPSKLAATHTVITYARRSFPPSSGAPPSCLDDHADDLARVIESFDGPMNVVGWSMGGVVALALAVRRPDLLRQLVVIEAPLHFKQRPSPRTAAAIGAVRALEPLSPTKAAVQFLRWVLRRADGSNDIGLFDMSAIGQSARAILGDLHLGTGEREVEPNALAALEIPVTWLLGGESGKAFAQAAQRCQSAQPATDIVTVPGAGHVVHMDRPDFVADCVASLTSKSAGPPGEEPGSIHTGGGTE